MNDVAEIDLEARWAATSGEVLLRVARTTRLALDVADVAILSRGAADSFVVRCVDGPLDYQAAHDLCATPCAARLTQAAPLPGEAQAPASVLCLAPLLAKDGQMIGALCAIADEPRMWTARDRSLLEHLGEDLADRIEDARRHEARTALAELDRLLRVLDRIPGLIFERRKVEGGQSAYTFFGRDKTRLPAIREMMGNGTTGALRFVHRDDRADVSAALIRSTIEETDLDLTFRIKDFDSGVRWVRSQSIVRKTGDGSVVWDGMCFDISDLLGPTVVGEPQTLQVAGPRGRSMERDDVRAPLAAIIKLAEFLKAEARSPLVTAHALTLQSNVEALMDTLRLDDATVEPMPVPPASMPGGATRILVADDLDLNRKLIADMLGLEGYVVDCASDGAEALKAVERQRYDLVLMDMMMPGMDGLAATRAIRALPAPMGSMPIVALTAHSSQDQLEKCLAAGMNAALTKPMSFDALADVVATWVQGRTKAA